MGELESVSGEGTGEKKLEMFEIQGRKNIEFARQTASEPKPINFETRSGKGTGEKKKLETLEMHGRNNVERKTASEAKPIDNGEKDDLRNPKTAEMVEIKEEFEEVKTAEMETEIES